jgi:hypothetical protein
LKTNKAALKGYLFRYIKSLSEALNNVESWEPPVAPSQPIPVNSILGESLTRSPAPSEMMRQSFESATFQLMKEHPKEVKTKFPELLQWRNAVDQRRINSQV